MDERSSLEPVEYWRTSEPSSRERPSRSVSEPEKSTSCRERVNESLLEMVAEGNGVAEGEGWRVVGDGAARREPEEIEAILSRTCRDVSKGSALGQRRDRAATLF